MRRRPPRAIALTEADREYLERLVRSGHTEQRVARRARLLLAMSDPAAVIQELAAQLDVSRMTIWNTCRKYQKGGLKALDDAPRSGRPREVSPPGAGRD